MKPKVIEVDLPEYTINTKPDYLKLGKKVDKMIEQSFQDGYYLERVLSLDDHPQMILDQLVSIISNTGTDRYDPKRKSVCHEQFAIYDYDLHLGSFQIDNQKIKIYPDDTYPTYFGEAIYNFYEHTPRDRGYRLRIDISVLYDPSMFQKAEKFPQFKHLPSHRFEKYLYKFKYPDQKEKAVKGIIKILR